LNVLLRVEVWGDIFGNRSIESWLVNSSDEMTSKLSLGTIYQIMDLIVKNELTEVMWMNWAM